LFKVIRESRENRLTNNVHVLENSCIDKK